MSFSRHQDAAALGLLSLATRPPVSIPTLAVEIDMAADMDLDESGQTNSSSYPANGATGKIHGHRRLASNGSTVSSSKLAVSQSKPKRERRLSDARDAASRPTISMIGSPPGLSMAALSLSTSTSSSTSFKPNNTSFKGPAPPLSKSAPAPPSLMLSTEKAKMTSAVKGERSGKGIDYKCESCSKIYRHPSCLIKHRWEHTPHWRAASAHVCSKHQQVQLLEAAAILSHLSRDSALPDDRSLWPSFCGSLPAPSGDAIAEPQPSTSVPGQVSRAPRMHDYSLDSRATVVRPGVVGVPTTTTPINIAHSYPSRSISPSSYVQSLGASSASRGSGIGAWTLPSSSVRSVSVVSSSSASRSRSSGSDDELEDDDILEGNNNNVAVVDPGTRPIYNYTRYGAYEDTKYVVNEGRYGFASRARGGMNKDDFEMEMDGQMDAGADGHLRVAYSLREEDEEEEKVIAVPRLLNSRRAVDEDDELEMDME